MHGPTGLVFVRRQQTVRTMCLFHTWSGGLPAGQVACFCLFQVLRNTANVCHETIDHVK